MGHTPEMPDDFRHSDEKIGHLGLPEEAYPTYTPPHKDASLDEFRNIQPSKETPEQQALFDILDQMFEDPSLAGTQMANLIEHGGLWRSVSSGELTPNQAVQLKRTRFDTIMRSSKNLPDSTSEV